MKPSIFNLTIPLASGGSVILNTFSGAIDFKENIIGIENETQDGVDDENIEYLTAQNYIIPDEIDEHTALRGIYSQILTQMRQNSPVHCVIIISFDCNLRCSYCWQQHKLPEEHNMQLDEEKCNSILKAIEELEKAIPYKSNKKPTIQLFGGEPLLERNKDVVEYILKECHLRGWNVQITTNGSSIESYSELINRYNVNEIQITVDGYGECHDRRRLGSSYYKIMDNIEKLLQMEKTYVKLRTNVDFENLESLPALAKDIIKRQWYTSRKFLAYLAPLRDSCLDKNDLISRRVELLQELIKMREKQPELEIFDFLGWDGYQAARQLENTGKLPYPKASICETNLNQFVFNPYGEIHVCSEEAHNTDNMIGRYWPQYQFDKERFSRWYDRGPLDIQNCKECIMLPICGGGCQLIDENTTFKSIYCKAVKNSFLLGVKKYFEGDEAV